MTVRELLTPLDGTTSIKVTVDGAQTVYTGTADRAPLRELDGLSVAKISYRGTRLWILAVDEREVNDNDPE